MTADELLGPDVQTKPPAQSADDFLGPAPSADSFLDNTPKMAQSALVSRRISAFRNPAQLHPGAQQQSFEDYLTEHPRPSDIEVQKLAPLAKTPEQQEQLGKFVAAKRAPEAPVGSVAGDAWEAAWTPPKPLVDLIQVERGVQQDDAQTVKAMRDMAVKHGLDPDTVAKLPSIPAQVTQGAGNALVDLASTFTSPAGALTLGMGSLPKAAQKTLSLAFATQMLSQAPGTAIELVNEINKPADQRDYKKIAELAVSGAGQVGFGALAAAHGLSPTPLAPPVQPPEVQTSNEFPLGKGPIDISVPGDSMFTDARAAQDRVTAAVSSPDKPGISGYDARLAGASTRLPQMGYAYDEAGDMYHPVRVTPPTEKGATDASQIPSATGVFKREVRPQVGQEAPLRQPGETPETQPAPQPQVPVNVVAEPEPPPTKPETASPVPPPNKPVAAPAPPENVLPKTPSGEQVVTVQRPDGTTYPASYGGKKWEGAGPGGEDVPSIGRVSGGSWSHGLLAPGEKILNDPFTKPSEQPTPPPQPQTSTSPAVAPAAGEKLSRLVPAGINIPQAQWDDMATLNDYEQQAKYGTTRAKEFERMMLAKQPAKSSNLVPQKVSALTGKAGTPAKKNLVQDYLNEQIDYGGEVRSRGSVIAEMQKAGTPQKQIDAYMSGAKAISKPTPMMEQYQRLKKGLAEQGAGDALLAFRLGDFYEFFFDDAKSVAVKLKLALTQRNGVPMAGLPYHAAESYFKKLTESGQRVAIADLSPEAEKLVMAGKPAKRSVTQILQPDKPVEQPKEAWQLTRAEIHSGRFDVASGSKAGEHTLNLEIAHRAAIRKALSEGKPVPPEVLAEYPDLAKQVEKPAVTVGESDARPPSVTADHEQLLASAKAAKDSARQVEDEAYKKFEQLKEKRQKAYKKGNYEEAEKIQAKVDAAEKNWLALGNKTSEAQHAIADLQERSEWVSAEPFNQQIWRESRGLFEMPKGRDKENRRQALLDKIQAEWVRQTTSLMGDREMAGSAVRGLSTLDTSVLSRPLEKSNQISNLAKTAKNVYERTNAKREAEDEINNLDLSPMERPRIETYDGLPEIQKKLELARSRAQENSKAKAVEAKRQTEEKNAEQAKEMEQARQWQKDGTLVWTRIGNKDKGNDRWKPVEGRPFKFDQLPGIRLFIHKGTEGWVITEESTGMKLSAGKNQAEARSNLEQNVTRVGVDKVKKLIAINLKETPPKPDISNPPDEGGAPKPVEPTPVAPTGEGQKYRVGNNPTPHTLVEKLPQSRVEIENNEQPVRVKNDRTGQVTTVMESDLTAIHEIPASEKTKRPDTRAILQRLGYTKVQISALTGKEARTLAERKQPKSTGGGATLSQSNENEIQPDAPLPMEGDVRNVRAVRVLISKLLEKYDGLSDIQKEGIRRIKPVEGPPVEGATGLETDATAWRAIASSFNQHIVFIDVGDAPLHIEGATIPEVPDTIFLNRNARNTLSSLIGHELLHNIKRSNLGLYNELVDKLKPTINDEFVGYMQTKAGQRIREGALPNEEQDAEELVADLFQRSFNDPAFWNKLAAKDPPFFHRLATTVLDFLNRLIGRLKNNGVYKYFTDIGAAHDAIADTLQKFRQEHGIKETGGSESGVTLAQDLPENKDSTTEQGNWVETIVMGNPTQVRGKEGTFGPQSTAASIAYAKSVFDRLNIPVTSETRTDPRRNNLPITFWRLADFGKADADGEKLVAEIRKEIAESQNGTKPPDLLASLLNSVRVNFEEGSMPFSEPIRQQLFNLSQGYYSWHAAILGAASAHSPDLLSVMKNVDVMLGRARYDAFGGDAYDTFFGRILQNFRNFFTPDEIEQAQKDFPALKAIMDRIIAQNYKDDSGRVYRKIQSQWREKFAPKLKQIINDARINEAAQAIIEEARNRFGIEPKPSKRKDITPYEKLLELVNQQTAAKVSKLMEGAVADAEYNAGRRAMEDAVKTESDPAIKQQLTDHLQLMAADETVQPLPEYVEHGLTLPEYSNWKIVRDNWFDYSPVTMRLVEQVIKGDFKGTRFGDKKASTPEPKIDLNALARQPEDEVRRVLDEYYQNYEQAMGAAGATDGTNLRVRQMIEQRVAQQLEQARLRARDPMFAPPKVPGAKLTAEQLLAQQLNAGLFKDVRLDIPDMVAQVAAKSRITNLLPKTTELVQKILNTPAFRQSDIEENFVNQLIDRLGVPEDQAQAAWKVFSKAFESRMATARQKALQAARQSLTPHETVVFKGNNVFWQKVERAVNAGILDSSVVLSDIARERGWIQPTPEQVKLIKNLVDREQQLRTLPKQQESQIRLSHPDAPPEETAAMIERARREQEAATYEQRSELIRRLGVEWTRMTRPINFLKYFSSKYRRNNAQALNEYETLDMLLKAGFGIFRLPTHITTQLVLHTPARAIGRAMTIRDNDIVKGVKRGKLDMQFWQDVHTALSDSVNATLASIKPAILSARAEIMGRGESRNIDRLMSGINALERLSAMAKREADAGRWWNAAILHMINLPRVVQWYVSAIDHFQGKPTEYQEILHQIEIKMREDGKNRAQINMAKDEVFKSMMSEFPQAVADSRSMLEGLGVEASDRQVEEAAQNLVRRRVFDKMQRLGLPADAFEQDINILKSTVSWQEQTNRGLGGAVASALRGGAAIGESLGIPTSITRLSNAIGTGMNYALMNTPFYKLANIRIPGSSKEPSTWFRTDLDRNHRMVQAIIGSSLGTVAGALALSGLATVQLMGPKDKKDRDLWITQGHKPGTVEFNLPDGTFIPISLSVGPASLLAPYFSTFGAVHDLFAGRAKAQAKLNAKAAAKGEPPGKISPITSLDALAVAGSALFGSIMGSRTASGLTASVTEQGIPNAQKLAASFVSPLIPGLPAFQEFSRMMGVQMDPKLASVWDYLVPLPTSPHRSVNVLGEPVETPDDLQRVVQVITAGSYPVPVNPNELKSQLAYNALFSTGYTPPSINPAKGYDIGGTFRPMSDSELQSYTIARGQNLKQALSNLGPNPTRQQVQQAYQQANASALQQAGVTLPQRAAQTGATLSTARPAAGHAKGAHTGLGHARHHALLPSLHHVGRHHVSGLHTRHASLLRPRSHHH